MDVLACVCTAIATALTIFISEAIWQRHKSKKKVGNIEKNHLSSASGTKTYSSEGVQVPDTDGLDSSAGPEQTEINNTCIGHAACQTDTDNINHSSVGLHENMAEKDNLVKLKVVSGGFNVSSKVDNKEFMNSDDSDLNEVFTFDKDEILIVKGDTQNNVDVVADNNKNHETETKCFPKQGKRGGRRMSDVIDSLGDSEKFGRYSRKSSSSSTPPATPPSDAGYSSVHSTPSHVKPSVVSPHKVRDATDAGFNIRAQYDIQKTANTATVEPSEENEITDAGPIEQQDEDLSDMIICGPVVEAYMPVGRDEDEYNMNHPRRGRAIIFNNDTFDVPGVDKRLGSEVDVKNLNHLFTSLDFEITEHHNKEYSEIKEIVRQLAQEDHSDADCIVIAVLTHGQKNGLIYSKDVAFSFDYLWQPFTADKCPTLAGKPKIFFVQACRGEKVDPGVKLSRSRTQTDSGFGAYKIPTHADFLFAYSSPEGFYSWRNPENGTWFIQCLCKEFMERAADTDLLKILTRTARRVATVFESFNDISAWQHEKKQVTSVTTMLIRDVYFRPKK